MKNVVSEVVNNDLCVGCGVCSAVCPTDSLKIKMNDTGTYEPYLINDQCDDSGVCIKVCPFNPIPNIEVKTEDEISTKIGIHNDLHKVSKVFGKYQSLHVGYAKDYRSEASSGGIATWLFKELFENKIIDYVIATSEGENEKHFFKYNIIGSIDELVKTSKTKYYPIEISEVLRLTKKNKGNYAVIGLPCTIKALRLAQIANPDDWSHLKFMISIFCGGLKSSFFTEYLASKVGVNYDEINQPQYRIKNIDSTAGDYSFSCVKSGEKQPRYIPMKEVGDMWGTGYFKPNACDFCEDLSGELADISLGDAWIPPFNKDGRGHSLIITRSLMSKKIIEKGINKGDLLCSDISRKQAFLSQEGNFNHRRVGLSYRIKWAKKEGKIIPPKRVKENYIENPLKSKIFRLRQKIQEQSTLYWQQERENEVNNFENRIRKTKNELLFYTKLEHLFRKKYWIRKLKLKK